MKKRILSVFILALGFLTSQKIFAGETLYMSLVNDDDVIERRFAGRGPDKDFKFDVEEITYDVASGEEFVMPELQNPHKLTIETYPTPDNQEQALTIVRDEKTHEITSIKVNKSFIGDFHIYASAKKSSKYGPSTAECLVHFINTDIIERIDFTSDDFESQKGNENGWYETGIYDVWSCQCSDGWYVNTWYKGISSYTECDLVSPEMVLSEEIKTIELIQSLTGFDNPERDVQLLVKEAGATEWLRIEGLLYEHEGSSYDFYAGGILDLPAEVIGKKVQFAFRFCTDTENSPARWAVREVRLMKGSGDTPTGIEEINAQGDINDDAVYDLMGRRVFNPSNGIYVINGKKVIIK